MAARQRPVLCHAMLWLMSTAMAPKFKRHRPAAWLASPMTTAMMRTIATWVPVGWTNPMAVYATATANARATTAGICAVATAGSAARSTLPASKCWGRRQCAMMQTTVVVTGIAPAVTGRLFAVSPKCFLRTSAVLTSRSTIAARTCQVVCSVVTAMGVVVHDVRPAVRPTATV